MISSSQVGEDEDFFCSYYHRKCSPIKVRTMKNNLYHSLFRLRADILALEELSKHLFLELHDLQNMR